METRANFVLIGVFTLAVIAGAFLFVLWFSGLTRISEHKTYEVLFTGSVSGLSRGSAVLFNGLRVGEVTQINFVAEDPSRVRVLVDVDGQGSDQEGHQGAPGDTGIDRRCGDRVERRRPRRAAVARGERRAADHRRRTLGIAEHHGERPEPVRQGRIGAGKGGQALDRQRRRYRRRGQERRHVLEGAQREFGGNQFRSGGIVRSREENRPARRASAGRVGRRRQVGRRRSTPTKCVAS